MRNSRDISLIVVFAVLSFIFQILIGEIPNLIPGIGYAFTILYSIIQAVTWLLYEGRRWRILAQDLLMILLVVSFVSAWTPPVVIATILNIFIVDLIFNSVYGFFKRKGRLFWWVIFAQVYYWPTHSLWILLFSSLYYPIQVVIENWFIPIMSVMLPVIIIEAIAGGCIGYRIYRRVEKLT